MDVKATAKFLRISPRKMDLLVRGIKKLQPDAALNMLKFTNKSGAVPLFKVISSAVNNAKQISMNTGDLRFKEIHVLPGGAMKRFRAVSRGMAHEYKKRMSHVTVILTQSQPSNPVSVQNKTEIKEKKMKIEVKKRIDDVKENKTK